MGKFYKIGFFVLLFLIIVGGTFYLGTKYNLLNKVKPTPTPAEDAEVVITKTPDEETVEIKDLDKVQETIRAAIDTMNTQALEGYMTDTVQFTIYASECCGDMTKVEAIKNLEYVKDGDNWNFDQNNETIKKLKEKSEFFGPDAYVGFAQNNENAVAFKFNESNMIDSIAVVASYKLITE